MGSNESTRSSLGWVVFLCVFFFSFTRTPSARADELQRVERVEVTGAKRTRGSTILDLLPRPPPASYTDAELAEVERRIRNLQIFDHVEVARAGSILRVTVREKWTLIPTFDFATGATFADTYIAVGATEYNVLGTGSQLALGVSHEQRGWNFNAGFYEHPYRPGRWALGVDGAYVTSSIRFDHSSDAWYRNQAGGSINLIAPMPNGSFWSYRVGASYARETSEDAEGTYRPPNGHELGTQMTLVWDRYVWNDLVPRGVRATLAVAPAWFLGPRPAQPRYRAELLLLGSLPLTRTTALMSRVASGVNSTGNANFSMLLGSFAGVRGLQDALYRNWTQAYANLELRQNIRLAERWALQAVLFGDAAAFAQMNARGEQAVATSALGAGGGLRLLPTALADFVLRVDLARLFYPYENLFVQLGTSQYF